MKQWDTGALPYETGSGNGRDVAASRDADGGVLLQIDDDEWDAGPVGVTLDTAQAAGLGCALLPRHWAVFPPPAAGWPTVTAAHHRVLVAGSKEGARSVADDLSDEHLRAYIASMIAVLRQREQVREARSVQKVLDAHLGDLA